MAPTALHEYRLGYRADIEGLRAVAIMLVVAAHAGVAGLHGGFVGVDVFFVLSGYLITGLLLLEIQATNRLDFARFYARRLRRLLPALLLMLAVTGPLALLLLPAADQPRQAVAAASAASWVSNFYFAFSDLGYFSPGAATNLFLHTWSLGLEEQFYLVWPAILIMTLAATRRNGGCSLPVRRLKLTMLAVLLVSLAACIRWTATEPHLAFYMMPTRAWQFALGALVFLSFGNTRAPGDGTAPNPMGRRWPIATGWAGLALILGSAHELTPQWPYPGTLALLPSLGAALVLAAGTRPVRWGVSRLLSTPQMQAIGRLSYAWYLWHWPVLLLGAIVAPFHGPAFQMALIALSLWVAMLTHRLVESPLRQKSRLVARPVTAILAALALMFAGDTLASYWHASAQTRLAGPVQAPFELARKDKPLIYGQHCDDWYRSSRLKVCQFGPADAPHTAIALGDSIGLQWFPALASTFQRPGWRLLVMTKSACPMVDAPLFYDWIGREYDECAAWRAAAIQRIRQLHPDILVIGSSYEYDFSIQQWRDGTRSVLRSLGKSVGHILVLRSTPSLTFNGPSCLAPRSDFYRAIAGAPHCQAPASNPRSDQIYHALADATAHVDRASLIDMNGFVCPGGLCRAMLDHIIVYRDAKHLTRTFVQSLARALERSIDSAIARDTPSRPPPDNLTRARATYH